MQKVVGLGFQQSTAQAGAGLCIAVTPHHVCTNVFFKSLACAELIGLWCLLEKSCAFSPSFLSSCPTQSDDLHFILLYFFVVYACCF